MSEQNLSLVLDRVAAGDPKAASDLLPIVYKQLRQAAQNAMNAERRNHTLQATALVHEAYAKLIGGAPVEWSNRAHFYDAAARAMRQILIDHARSKQAAKRGGNRTQTALSHFAAAFDADSTEILALDAALSRLESEEPELAVVVRMRFFAGLSGDEAARAIGVSPRKVDALWAHARAWLYRAMEGGRQGG